MSLQSDSLRGGSHLFILGKNFDKNVKVPDSSFPFPFPFDVYPMTSRSSSASGTTTAPSSGPRRPRLTSGRSTMFTHSFP